MVEARLLDATVRKLTSPAIDFLCELIRMPSTRGNEGPVIRHIHSALKEACDEAHLMNIPGSFTKDALYSWPLPDLSYESTQNLRLVIHGSQSGRARSILFNTHADVVPPSKGQTDPFLPKIIRRTIHGRGACDAKGQIAVLYLLLRCLRELKLRPRGDLIIDFVVEEENGGNGTLFMVRNPVKTDAAIVLEPTGEQIFAATRGAVWFELSCFGKSGHSGSTGGVVSALKLAVKAMNAIECYHDELLIASRGKNRLFDAFENPMPVTFGMMHAGDWPATVPAMAVVKGVFGFLPNSRIQEVQEGMVAAVRSQLTEHQFEIAFNMLNNEGCELPDAHPLTETLKSARIDAGRVPVVSAFTAACDAWRYHHQLGTPTLVFGAGDLKYAHSNEEQISADEIAETARTLFHFIDRWSGFHPD